jgi:hypothetical protein
MRVLVCLEEAGAEYEIVPMSPSGGDHRRLEHLARNVSSDQTLVKIGMSNASLDVGTRNKATLTTNVLICLPSNLAAVR